MRFNLVINMERMSPNEDMRDIVRHITEMVQMADDGGIDIVWAAEHHAIEMTIAPSPFQLLSHFAANTSNIRLGTGVAVAPYWHPIKLAGEAALLDLLSGGRLEFGIGKGAYQREFDRMAGGLKMNQGIPIMQEMLPALKALWQGDYEHNGKYWSFPLATSCPKPLQKPYPPIWVAARDPSTFEWAIKNDCDVMSWALVRPFSEVQDYYKRFNDALNNNTEIKRPRFMTMRHSAVYSNKSETNIYINAVKQQGKQFENLFRNLAPVVNGFPETVDQEKLTNQNDYGQSHLLKNLIFGPPDQVIAKLKPYEALGVDYFCYMASYGLPMKEQKSSLKLFIEEVMPAFQGKSFCSNKIE